MKARILRLLELPCLIAVAAALFVCALLDIDTSALLTLLVAVFSVLIFFLSFQANVSALRQVLPAAVLGAFAAAGRILFASIPDFKPVTAICIVAGAVFGRRCGFMVGCLAALVSNFFFGQGPWTAWQMYAWGLIGYCAGVLSDVGALSFVDAFGTMHVRTVAVCVFGFLSCLIYGFILNTWTLVGFVHPITLASAFATYGAGLPFDLVHGAATVFFLLLIYVPWVQKLTRIKEKYALVSG